MSPLLIILLCFYPLLGVGSLLAFVRAARRTNEDWELQPTLWRVGMALQRAEDQALREPQSGLPSRAG